MHVLKEGTCNKAGVGNPRQRARSSTRADLSWHAYCKKIGFPKLYQKISILTFFIDISGVMRQFKPECQIILI